MYRILLVVGLAAVMAACGDDSPTAPSVSTSSITVTVSSPVRMGQTTQSSGTAMLSNGQSQAVTSGWLSDAPGVATVSDAGLVTGVSNGRATIYVVSGGRQGQQVTRVVPDYQGSWSGATQVTACTQTGAWVTANFCGSFTVGSTDPYTLSLAQSGENLTARLSYGPTFVFPSVAAAIGADGTSPFSAAYVDPSDGFTVAASVLVNSLRVGELSGTINEVWRLPGVSGEGTLAQNIVGTTRTSTTALIGGEGGVSGKRRVLDRLGLGRR